MSQLDAPERQRLAELPLLAGLPADFADALAAACAKRALAPGDVIIEEGAANDSIYILFSGSAEVRLDERSPTARRVSAVDLARLGPGSVFGEYSMLDGRPASASVVATAAGVVARVQGRDLTRLLAADALLAERFYRNLVVQLVGRLRAKDAELDVLVLG